MVCSGKSAEEVIASHDDFANRYRVDQNEKPSVNKKKTSSPAPLSQRPTMTVVREPRPQFVLVMETSAAMDAHGQWRWINRAAQVS